jgi:nitrogen regulatory protein P-II 1
MKMKRIEATIQTDKVSVVSEAIKDKVGGFTIMDGDGRGSGKRHTIRSGRGTGSIEAEYNKVSTITTIVDDDKVESITSAIADAARTGASGDGIVVVTGIENVTNIASKKSGSEAL